MARAMLLCLCLAAGMALVPSAPTGDDQSAVGTVVYRGARILPVAGDPVDNGALVVRQGKIVSVGPMDRVSIPEGARVVDFTGKTIIPGMVDTHSHIGIFPRPTVPAHGDGNETSGPVQPGVRALDAIYPDDPGIRMAVAGGITTANIMPGSSNVIGGQTLYVKLRGRTVDDMRIQGGKVLGGLKMANGENPKNYGRKGLAPVTRMKVAALQREQFAKARDYRRKWDSYRQTAESNGASGKPATPPDTDLSLDPLVEVLDRKRTVHFHSHRADDLLTAVRLAQEFGFELVLHHATEGYRIADVLTRLKIPVSLTLADSPGGKLETMGVVDENAAVLEKAGVTVAINTDDFITESRFFLRTGSIAVRGGMPEASALRALTLTGARLLHLDDRLGSLEQDKDADFVVLSGPPFSIYTRVLATYIDGLPVFDRTRKEDWSYQAGGFGLPDLGMLPPPPRLALPLPPATLPQTPSKLPPARGRPQRMVVLAGRIHTVGRGTIMDAAVLIENGKIRYVGPRSQFDIPEKTPVLTAAEVTPGLIDAHSVVGLSGKMNIQADQDQDETADPNQAELRVLDGLNPNEPLLQFLVAQGVTLIHATPGRANILAGQTGIFRTSGRTADQMAVRFPAGLLVNLGEVPKQAYLAKGPTTRMGTAALLRNQLVLAEADLKKRSAARDDDKRPARNLKLEILETALAGKIPVYFSAHRADDLMTALRLAKEFNLRPVLDLATEGYLVADSLAAAGVPVILHPTMQRVGSPETYHTHVGNAAILADRKILLAISTNFEGYVPKTRVVRGEAAMAMVNGLGRDRALRAITLDAARLLQVEDRYGSLEVGKAADLVLYDGDPFENTTHVTHTVMDGRVVYDRAEMMRLPFARRALPLIGSEIGCCMSEW